MLKEKLAKAILFSDGGNETDWETRYKQKIYLRRAQACLPMIEKEIDRQLTEHLLNGTGGFGELIDSHRKQAVNQAMGELRKELEKNNHMDVIRDHAMREGLKLAIALIDARWPEARKVGK